MLLFWMSALALAEPAGPAFGHRAGWPFEAELPGSYFASRCGVNVVCCYYQDSSIISDPVTGTFSVNFNFDPAGEIPRTTLLLPRGPRPIPLTIRPR